MAVSKHILINCENVEIAKVSDTSMMRERASTHLGRCRRLRNNWGKSIVSAEAGMLGAYIRILTQKLVRRYLY
jgi:hypothetical protein